MKKLSQDGRLNIDVIFSILTEEKPNQKEKLNIQRERIDRFFPKSFTEKQKEGLIVQLLESWYKNKQEGQVKKMCAKLARIFLEHVQMFSAMEHLQTL